MVQTLCIGKLVADAMKIRRCSEQDRRRSLRFFVRLSLLPASEFSFCQIHLNVHRVDRVFGRS